jgi:hypothetical protein
VIDCGLPLRVNHTKAFPSHLILLDTETNITPTEDGEVHTFRLGWTCELTRRKGGDSFVEDWRFHDDAQDFNTFLESVCIGKSTTWILAHNLFFDLQACGFFPYFTMSGWRLDFLYDKGLTFCMVIKKRPSAIKLLSTTNWFDVSLEELGKDVGIEKLSVDFKTTGEKELAVYCRRDVEILKASLLKYMSFCKEHDTGRFAMTRASQSFAAYRHRFMHEKIHVHQDPRVKLLERAGYFGGRVEAFRLGTLEGGPFVFLDVNSMYPYVMRENLFPSRLLSYSEDPKNDRWEKGLEHEAIMAEVNLSTDMPLYAVKRDGKLLFPVGEFSTVLCTESLKEAIRRGHLLSVTKWALYQAKPLFRSYVDYFYPLKAFYRAQGEALYTRIVKLFLNSLYGKFGSRAPLMDTFDCPDFPGVSRETVLDATTGERWIEYAIMGTLVRLYGEVDTKMTVVSIAAHVTDCARVLLGRIIESIGWNRVLYCDTDSVVIRKADLQHVSYPLDVNLLGALTIAQETKTLTLYGCKDYETDQGRKTKGVPHRATPCGVNAYRYLQFDRLVTSLRSEVAEGIATHWRTKTLSGVYDKGIVSASGVVSPFHLLPG